MLEGSFSGTIKNEKPHGIGRFISDQGLITEGQFKNGKKYGYIREINGVAYTVGKIDERNIWRTFKKYDNKNELLLSKEDGQGIVEHKK